MCHGEPTVRGLRYPVATLIAYHADLERDDLLAALEYGALAADQRLVVPLQAD